MSTDYKDHEPTTSSAGPAAAPSGKVGAPIFRKAAGDGVAGASAAADAHGALEGSSGQALPDGVRGKMERAFGADFSDVRVHAGSQGGAAADAVGARAFATGENLAFSPGQYDPEHADGQHLLAHELAHVVQQRGGTAAPVQMKAAVSSVGDASETAADAAADAVVRGDKVGSVGTASATIQRDAMGDLKDAASGNWLGSVDGSAVNAKAAALPGPDKAALAADSGGKYDDLKTRIFKKLNAANSITFMFTINMVDLRWRMYWLNIGNTLDELNAEQWQWLMGYVTPAKMDELRKYPTGFNAFIKNAPLELIPPWDRLQGLVDGTWKGQAVDVRNAVLNLNPDQKAKVRADNAKMAAILARTGDVNERFRVVTYLDFKVKDAVFWLDAAKSLPALNETQWSQMLAEATRADYDALVAAGAQWALVQKYCPAGVLQVTRQNSDPATATKAFDDPVQIQTMFTTLGPAGFLATAVKDPTTVDDVYKKVKAGGKLMPTVQGLPTGSQIGAAAKASLRIWMYTPSADDADCAAIFEQRFRVSTRTGTSDHDHAWNKKHTAKVANGVDLQPFTKEGLRQMWGVCEMLPPAAVENNPKLFAILRDQKNGPGNAYYRGAGGGPDGDSKGDVLMAYGGGADATKAGGTANDDLATNVSPTTYVYQAGGQGPGSAAVNLPKFNATLRHEIGHAVDASLSVMDTWMRQEEAGGWIKYDSWTAWVDAMISNGGGMSYGSVIKNAQYRQGMIDAVSGKTKLDFSAALTAKGITPPASDPGGPVSAVWTTDLWTGQPWYDESWKRQGTRNFQCAYGGESTLYSFRADIRDRTKVTAYQWRAPGEWFAECYQVYYSETESGVPGTPVGGVLRSKDSAAADMISSICDRGFSPQDMRGGTTNKAPGT